MALDPLLVVSIIIALGAISKLVGDRYHVPNVVFLLAFGVLIGPEGLGIVSASLTSEQLSLFVGIAVAIIVFEGAFSLSRIRTTSRATLSLVTVGSAITFVGLGLAIRALLGVQWSIAFLVSALLVATGPTVIKPVLEQVRVPEKVASTLETEGIINDPVAAVLGAVVFSVAIAPSRTPGGGVVVTDFVTQLSIGVLVGIVTAVALGVVLLRFSTSVTNAHIVVLAAALLAFAVATVFATEAGVVAVAVAGLALGSGEVPFQEEIAGFSGVLSSIVLSAVYIVLAALIQFEDVLALGLGGLAVVLLAMLVVRPTSVFVSTYGTEFTRNQRLFVAAIGPRGIIPAATATLFSLELDAAGVANATIVASLVFLVILVTVVTEAGGAPLIARKLDIVPMTTLIIGGGEIGRRLADDMDDAGENPIIVERDEDTVTALRTASYSVVHGDGTDDHVLARAGADDADLIVATTGDDAVNILACQTARTKFGVERLVSLVNDPTKAAAFEDLGVLTITPVEATVTGIRELLVVPSLFEWRQTLGRKHRLAEETVVSDDVNGQRIRDVGLPAECVVVLLRRGGEFLVPGPDVVLQHGDDVTVFGQSDAVETAATLLSGTK